MSYEKEKKVTHNVKFFLASSHTCVLNGHGYMNIMLLDI